MTPFYKVLVSFNGFVYDVRMVVLIVHNSEKAAMNCSIETYIKQTLVTLVSSSTVY